MKNILLFTTMLLSIYGFGQKLTGKVPGVRITNQEISTENDTIIKVVYKNENQNNKKPAYFLNNKIVNESILRTINPNEISTVNVEKENIEIENVTYYGKIYFTTKSTYKPKLISLNSLKLKFTNIKENSTIFKIDDSIINGNYENYLVDENNILKINVEKFENNAEKLNINIITIVTKSEENIKKSKEIILRGEDEFTINK